jgi:hypothetical protein
MRSLNQAKAFVRVRTPRMLHDEPFNHLPDNLQRVEKPRNRSPGVQTESACSMTWTSTPVPIIAGQFHMRCDAIIFDEKKKSCLRQERTQWTTSLPGDGQDYDRLQDAPV